MSIIKSGKRRLIQIDWTGGYVALSAELSRFGLRNLERSSLYVMPHHLLNSMTWREFEATMRRLQGQGKCRGWRVVNLN